ncbi:hypothetical protein VTL71DRAFT_14619 [Oculimacula yallundae]|uniref:Uncharacterized protein n=1 Tax=Oculimacula yallundae TaxID=86028 RepID=A0ABR4CJL1_9HELO
MSNNNRKVRSDKTSEDDSRTLR